MLKNFLLLIPITLYPCINAVSYARQTITGKDFSGQDLTGADFSAATLYGCIFKNAKLDKANFSDALIDAEPQVQSDGLSLMYKPTTFADAQLQQAVFDRARIHANFDSANLTQATFHDAMITMSSFNFATIEGAQFTRSTGNTAVLFCDFICAEGMPLYDKGSVLLQQLADQQNKDYCTHLRTLRGGCQ